MNKKKTAFKRWLMENYKWLALIPVVIAIIFIMFNLTCRSPSSATNDDNDVWWTVCPGWPDCPPVVTWPVQPTFTWRPTPTCLDTPTCQQQLPSPTPYPTLTDFPPQPTFGSPPTCTPIVTPTLTLTPTVVGYGVYWDKYAEIAIITGTIWQYYSDEVDLVATQVVSPSVVITTTTWRLFFDLEIRQEGQVLATQVVTTGLNATTEPGSGLHDGMFTWDWKEWQFDGIVEEWIRVRWSAEGLDDIYGWWDSVWFPRDERGFSLRRTVGADEL